MRRSQHQIFVKLQLSRTQCVGELLIGKWYHSWLYKGLICAHGVLV